MNQLDKIHRKFRNSKTNARRRGIDFSISREDYTRLFNDTTCAVTGRRLVLGHPSEELRPTIDRVDNTKGYEIGNVQIVSERMNRIKNDSTVRELELIVKYMRTCL